MGFPRFVGPEEHRVWCRFVFGNKHHGHALRAVHSLLKFLNPGRHPIFTPLKNRSTAASHILYIEAFVVQVQGSRAREPMLRRGVCRCRRLDTKQLMNYFEVVPVAV